MEFSRADAFDDQSSQVAYMNSDSPRDGARSCPVRRCIPDAVSCSSYVTTKLVSTLHQSPEGMDHTKPDLECPLKKSPQPLPAEKQTSSSWIPAVALLFLTVSCAQAIYRAWADSYTVLFIVFAYSTLLLLFWCLRRLDSLPRTSLEVCEHWNSFLQVSPFR